MLENMKMILTAIASLDPLKSAKLIINIFSEAYDVIFVNYDLKG